MQLKTADDRAPDIEALEALRRRPVIDARTARMIEDENWSIRLGAKAEADAAYQLDFDVKDSGRWAVIHDLRLDIEGQVAQIDHLVISRMLEVLVCESKSYSRGVKVIEYGDRTSFADRRAVGIPSPIEQNRRHIAVMERAIKLGYVELPRRVIAIKPTFINIVLVSQNGSIGRPRKKAPELDAIVKVDQFRSHLLKRDFSNLSILKLVSSDTLERFGRQLVALHQPSERDWAMRFGLRDAGGADRRALDPTRTRAGGRRVLREVWVPAIRGRGEVLPLQQAALRRAGLLHPVPARRRAPVEAIILTTGSASGHALEWPWLLHVNVTG